MFAIAEIASLWESFHGGRALRYFHFQFLRRANGDDGECAVQFFPVQKPRMCRSKGLSLFSDSRSRSLYAIARPSVVCNARVHAYSGAVEIFGNFSAPFGTLVDIHGKLIYGEGSQI